MSLKKRVLLKLTYIIHTTAVNYTQPFDKRKSILLMLPYNSGMVNNENKKESSQVGVTVLKKETGP